MKKYLALIIICAVSMTLIPLTVTKDSLFTEKTSDKTTQTVSETAVVAEENTTEKVETIQVFLSQEKKTVDIDMFEYVCGSVAAEMPLAYEDEAIKAQAVACYTNALRMKKGNSESGTITDDPSLHQGYINKTERMEKWGGGFEKYETKLQKNVKEVFGKAIYYNNNLCVAAFCAISNGKTENAENIWNNKISYLKSVDSLGDKESEKYESSVTYSKEEVTKIAESNNVSLKNFRNSLKILKMSDSDTVLQVQFGNKTFTGEEIRKMFALRSPTFDIKLNENVLTFTVRGYGHGVGMSQFGADYYAKQGYTYEEILKHYYSGIIIK